METLRARRAWADVLQTIRDNGYQPKLLYPEKLPVTTDEENKTFYDTVKFKQYLFTNPALHKVLEGKPGPKEVNYTHENTGNK